MKTCFKSWTTYCSTTYRGKVKWKDLLEVRRLIHTGALCWCIEVLWSVDLTTWKGKLPLDVRYIIHFPYYSQRQQFFLQLFPSTKRLSTLFPDCWLIRRCVGIIDFSLINTHSAKSYTQELLNTHRNSSIHTGTPQYTQELLNTHRNFSIHTGTPQYTQELLKVWDWFCKKRSLNYWRIIVSSLSAASFYCLFIVSSVSLHRLSIVASSSLHRRFIVSPSSLDYRSLS